MNSNCLFSVIVPAYNSSPYLNKCVESVLGQTFGSFELILVDDGSTDDTLNICNSYSKADSRVKVIHKENGGHTSARNEGLLNATGEFVLFLDSDDWLGDNVLEICHKEVQKSSPDIIVYQIYSTLLESCFKNTISYGTYKRETNYDKINNALMMDKNGRSAFINGISGKVFRKTIILKNQLSVPPELRIAEDAAAFIGAVMDSSTISVVPEATYYCLVHDGSVSHTSDEKAFSRIPYLIDYYNGLLAESETAYLPQYKRYIIAQLYTALLFVSRSGINAKTINREFEKLLKIPEVSDALDTAEFGLKGYKFILKRTILRYHFWKLAIWIDRR